MKKIAYAVLCVLCVQLHGMEKSKKSDLPPFKINFLDIKNIQNINALETNRLKKEAFNLALLYAIEKSQKIMKGSQWIGEKKVLETDIRDFAIKRIIPSNAKIFVHADYHGSIHPLFNFIDYLREKKLLKNKKLKKDIYLVFLGDLTDRGTNGAGVLYTILVLFIYNPWQVFILRGNHETIKSNTYYGFLYELNEKDLLENQTVQLLQTLYNHLPLHLFIGYKHNKLNHFLCCMHGAPNDTWTTKEIRRFLQHKDNLLYTLVPNSLKAPSDWNDINLSDTTSTIPKTVSERGVGCCYPLKWLEKWLNEISLKEKLIVWALLKGHQHAYDVALTNADSNNPQKCIMTLPAAPLKNFYDDKFLHMPNHDMLLMIMCKNDKKTMQKFYTMITDYTNAKRNTNHDKKK